MHMSWNEFGVTNKKVGIGKSPVHPHLVKYSIGSHRLQSW